MENKEYMRNFDGETCWMTSTWMTEKERGGRYQDGYFA